MFKRELAERTVERREKGDGNGGKCVGVGGGYGVGGMEGGGGGVTHSVCTQTKRELAECAVLKRNSGERKVFVNQFGQAVRLLSPFLTGRMFVRPNILRTLRRTMIRFLTELLVRRIWFGQSKLYFILNWLVMRCKLRPELASPNTSN